MSLRPDDRAGHTGLPPDVVIVDQPHRLDDVIDAIARAKRVALDTEFIREGRYFPFVCLAQLAINDKIYVVDPLKILDILPLWKALLRKDLTLIVHSGFQDLQIIYEATGSLPSRIIDVQVAAGFAGFGYPMAYHSLVSGVLGKTLAKSATYTRWERRPLTPEQLAYAADDVRHLFPISDALIERFDSLPAIVDGEEVRIERLAWSEQEIRRQVAETRFVFDPDQELIRLGKYARRLDGHELTCLRELLLWRERTARATDRPLTSVAKDETLVDMARKRPGHPGDLRAFRGLQINRNKDAQRELLSVIGRAATLPPTSAPKAPPRNELPPATSAVVDLLYAGVRVRATHAQVAPELVAAPKDVLAWLIAFGKKRGRELRDAVEQAARPSSTGSASIPVLARGWRADFVGPILFKLLSGELRLRPYMPDGGIWPELAFVLRVPKSGEHAAAPASQAPSRSDE